MIWMSGFFYGDNIILLFIVYIVKSFSLRVNKGKLLTLFVIIGLRVMHF